jgi:hypothetical protein
VGRIVDKFKLNWSGGVLTTVSQAASNNIVSTRVETFRVPHPLSAGPLGIIKLGELQVAPREQLFATRFDSNRLYVVTFGTIIRIDPLWVIDLSDPQKPKVSANSKCRASRLICSRWAIASWPSGSKPIASLCRCSTWRIPPRQNS